MNFGLLPDLAAMAILIAILLVLRRRHPKKSVDLWLLGLFFIFIESLARLFYPADPHAPPHRPLHIIALDAYALAGIVFTSGAGRERFSRSNRLTYLACNTIPILAVLTLYGTETTNRAWFLSIILLGLLTGVATSISLHRSWHLILAQLTGWLPMAWFIQHNAFREAAYWGLFCLYVLAALAFQKSLPRKSTGRIAILTGFSIWALCFLTHPWATHHQAWQDINNQVWNMQKFLISIGMLIVMLEDQIASSEWLALHDQLTGLPNRRLFDDRLTHAMGRFRRLRSPVALIMIDLDGFKNINDSYGHAAGDELLCGVASNLRQIIRTSDTLARIGGDEFVVLASDLPPDLVESNSIPRLAEAIQIAISQPILIAGSLVSISGSLGVATAPDDGITAELLLQAADKRMYKLKKQAAWNKPSFTIKARAL